jgi:DNA replication initiation complex subunit (GINS family)
MEYLIQKHAILTEQGTKAGVFGANDYEKTRIQIVNIKKIVKDLYERRQGKIIRMAVNSSKVNSSFINKIAMLPDEKKFFDEMLEVLRNNRGEVLNSILFYGNGTGLSSFAYEHPKPEPKKEQKKAEPVKPEPQPEFDYGEDEPASEEEDDPNAIVEESPHRKQAVQEKAEDAVVEEEPKPADEYDIKVKVRFKGAVPKFVGKKMELYGPFKEGDEADLPRVIANILVNKKRAEEI